MPAKEGWYAAMMERRPMVARLLLRHQKPGAIHRAMLDVGQDVSYDTIRRDISAIEATWHEVLLTEPIAMKSRELAEIDEAMRECWAEYTRTKDLACLRELRLWMERKAKLMGLDAVQVTRTEITGPDGGPVKAEVGIEVLFADRESRDLIEKLAIRMENLPGSDSQ